MCLWKIFLFNLQSTLHLCTITKIVEVFSVHKTKKSKNNGIDGPLTSQLLILMIAQ